MTQASTSARRKPILDEESFQQLLEAASVLQAHNDQLHSLAGSNGNATRGLVEIVEIQKAIESRELDVLSASRLIATCTMNLTGASGVAIGIIEGRDIIYRVATGTASRDEDLHVPVESSLSEQCIATAQLVQLANLEELSPTLASLSRQYATKSLIAVPILHDARVVGVLELRSDHLDSFHETEVHLAELMAGLLSDAMQHDSQPGLGESAAAEKAVMLEAIETLRPELERLIGGAEASQPKVARPSPDIIAEAAEKTSAMHDAEAICRCGSRLEEGEKFCGKCGTARFKELRQGAQSKLASMWYLQQAQSAQSGNSRDHTISEKITPSAEQPVPLEQIIARMSPPITDTTAAKADASIQRPDQDAQASEKKPEMRPESSSVAAPPTPEADSAATSDLEAETVMESAPIAGPEKSEPELSTAIVPVRTIHAEMQRDLREIQLSTWTSASRAREWWESLKEHKPDRRWLAARWDIHRGSIWVGIALIVLLGTILINGSPSPKAVIAKAHHGHAVEPNLTLFEKLLVSLGLAEAPPASPYQGNPATQVWIDVHTALYYCPGADLYGKTDGGKIISQHEAQLDQFEPANREACD